MTHFSPSGQAGRTKTTYIFYHCQKYNPHTESRGDEIPCCIRPSDEGVVALASASTPELERGGARRSAPHPHCPVLSCIVLSLCHAVNLCIIKQMKRIVHTRIS